MSKSPVEAFIVSHTHWDREWYLTFDQFRMDLIPVISEVLDRLEAEDEFAYFVLDGQAVAIEDYLEVAPGDTDRVRRAVKRGALVLGPWYVLADEFLVSGEALVRNLLIGHQVALGLGKVQQVGYVPDSFGHIAQLPQVLTKANIESFIYSRGDGDEIEHTGHEYWWRAPDGSEVLALHQAGGYCIGAALGFENDADATTSRQMDPKVAVDQMRRLLALQEAGSNTSVRLVSNGCDHNPPQRDFAKVLSTLRTAFPDVTFRPATYKHYADAVRRQAHDFRTFQGELLGGSRQLILNGVWSSRMYLKRYNDLCQGLLAHTAEPLLVYGTFLHGHTYPADSLRYAWKTLLKNHAHDSICGCSIDEVHRDMETRFDAVERTAERMVSQALAKYAPIKARVPFDDTEVVIVVANSLPFRRTEVVERTVVLEGGAKDLAALRLVDDEGKSVPFEVVQSHLRPRTWGFDFQGELWATRQRAQLLDLAGYGGTEGRPPSDAGPADCFATIRFVARDLPAIGYRHFSLSSVVDAGMMLPTEAVSSEGDTIQNDLVAVTAYPDGTFDLHDRLTNRIHLGLHRMEDVADAGDEYDFCPIPGGRCVDLSGVTGTVVCVEQSPIRSTLEVRRVLPLPEGLTADRGRRSSVHRECEVIHRFSVTTGSPVVEIETVFDNRVRDHRLRVTFPTSMQTDELISDGQFMIHRRPFDKPSGNDWTQPPGDAYPQQRFSAIEDGTDGLAVVNCGLPEVHGDRGEDGATLALTLLRSVAWLSRDDLETRRHRIAGPMVATPGAQCLGRQVFRYAVIPYARDHATANIKRLAECFATPVAVRQGVRDGSIPGGVSFLAVDNPQVWVSAVKRHEKRHSVIVRLVNLSEAAESVQLECAKPIVEAWRVNLLEERDVQVYPNGTGLSLEIAAHAIVTLELVL